MTSSLVRKSHFLAAAAATLHQQRHTFCFCSSSLVAWKPILANHANIGGGNNGKLGSRIQYYYENLRMDGFRQFSSSSSSSSENNKPSKQSFEQVVESLASQEWRTMLIRLVGLLPHGFASFKMIDNSEHTVCVKRKHTGELIKVVVTDRAGKEVESQHQDSHSHRHDIHLGVTIFKRDEPRFSLGFISTACPADGCSTVHNMHIHRGPQDSSHQIVLRDQNVSYEEEKIRFYCKISEETACKIKELLEMKPVASAPDLSFDDEDTFVRGIKLALLNLVQVAFYPKYIFSP
ncbi:hypothetical protein AQUCO_05800220v1 [Aquilegia coerulea]|uniref:Uncharacterized protein n=1 Tax=Aquilegia coerulea TaxID=218851 RepID=A0A2G5CFI9_AQUCA|nr:hypothetical protein AQUCO_05800220v1 [Aquilegia coerulea]